MGSVLRSALARALSFVPIAIATLLTSRLILGHYGIAAFDAYALMLSLIFLIPLNNLGVGAAVISSYAADGPKTDHSWRVTLTATRALALSTIGTALVSLVLGMSHVWSALLGPASGSNVFIGIAMAVYAGSFVPGLGTSMLLGVHRNHISVLIQTFFAPIILLGVVGLILIDADSRWLVIVPAAGITMVSMLTAAAARRATDIRWAPLLSAAFNRRKHPGARIRNLSGPIFLSTLATPIALQSDRVVLSHVSNAEAIAQYSVVMQIIAPALALVAASAQPLWPIFASARARGEKAPRIGRTVLLFAIVATLAGAALASVANPLATLISGNRLELGVLIPITAALIVVTSAMTYPLSMNLMSPTGVRFITLTTVIALPLNIGLSIILAHKIGAAGPLLATVIVGLSVQTAPALYYSRRNEHDGKHRPARRVSGDPGGPIFEGQPVVINEFRY